MIAWPLAAQNGCQSSYTWLFGSTCSLFQFWTNQFCSKWLPFCWIAYLRIDCSKWLPIHDCLAIGSSKWLPFFWYLSFWILMLLVPVQTWSALLKMASIKFKLTIKCSKWLQNNDCLTIGNSKWLPIYFYLVTWLQMLLGPIQTWSVMLKMAAILRLFSTTAKQMWMWLPTSILADLEFEYLFEIKTLSGRP